MNLRTLAAVLLLVPVSSWAAPNSGDYATDPAVVSLPTDPVQALTSQVNTALCILSQAVPETIVNEYAIDPYLAVVEGAKCQGEDVPEEVLVSATSTRAPADDAPQMSKGHIAANTRGGGAIAFHMKAWRAPEAEDFGRWTLNYTVMSTGDMPRQRGRLEANGTQLTMSAQITEGDKAWIQRMAVLGGGSARKGAFQLSQEEGGKLTAVFKGAFAQNAESYCLRITDGEGVPQTNCFSVDRAQALPITVQYRLYDDVSGALYRPADRGMLLRSSSTGAYAYATYRQVQGANADGLELSPLSDPGTVFKVYRPAGSLVLAARQSASFDSLAMRPFRATLRRPGAFELEPVEMRWNAAQQRFEILGVVTCDQAGCVAEAVPRQFVLPSELPQLEAKDFAFVKPGEMGEESVTFEMTPAMSPDAAPIARWIAQTLVEPGSGTQPLALRCARDCPTAARIAAATEAEHIYVPETTSQQLADVVVSYTWDPVGMVLKDDTGAVLDLDKAENLAVEASLATGPLVRAAVFNAIQEQCQAKSGSGCAIDIFASLDTEHWRWQMFRGNARPAFLVAPDGSYRTFTQRPRALWEVPDVPQTYGAYAGSLMDLFVDTAAGLGGFPAGCYSQSLERTECQWADLRAPAVAIPEDGVSNRVMVDGQPKWVRRASQVLRLRPVSDKVVEEAITDLPDLPPPLTGDAEDPSVEGSSVYAGDPGKASFVQGALPVIGPGVSGQQLQR